MSDEIFGVGFSVDTSQLQNAKMVSEGMTKALQQMAEAMERQEAAATKSAAADAKKAVAQREAAEAAKRNTEAHQNLAKAEKELADATEKAVKATADEKPALEAKAKALKEAADAAKAAADAEARRTAAARASADAAARTAQTEAVSAQRANATTEAVRRQVEALQSGRSAHAAAGEAMVGMGAKAQTVAGHVGTLTQGLLSAGQAMQSGGGLGQGMGTLSQGLTGLGGAMGGVTGGALAMTGGVLATVAAIGTLITVTGKQAEEFMLLEGRLKNVYGSASKASEVFGQLIDLSNKNGIAINQTAESFLRIARNNEAIGLTTKEMLDLTDAVQKLGRVSGTSQGELAGAMMQFSQALAAGKLNGDELRSIMENMPALAKAIADGLGVSVGQIRAMGAAGELTSDKITGAILKQLPEINAQFEGLPQTSEQAFTRVANAWDVLLAGMGKSLNSSGVLTWFGNTLAGMVEGAAEVVTPESNRDTILRLEAERAKGGPSWTMGASGGLSAPIPMDVVNSDTDRQLQEAFDRRQAEAMLSMQAALQEQMKQQKAPYLRSEGVVKEIDDQSKKVSEITSNIKALDGALQAFKDHPDLFAPEEAARLEKYPGLIAALKNQLAQSLPVLDDYRAKTARMTLGMFTYGAGGAGSVLDEADALAKSMAAKGQSVLRPDGSDGTMDAATEAIMQRRVVTVAQQTEAMKAQVQAQETLTEAVGKGAAAQVEAEVANKAYDLQMQQFGETLDGPAAAAMDRYKDQLRELLTAQNELTSAQKLYNAELQLAIERQITAAIKAGATAEEVARLRQSLQLGQSFTQEMGGTASQVTLGGNGGGIPPDLQAAFDAASAASGVPVAVLAAMAKQESGFNNAAVSPTGALGVMQILPSTAADPGYGMSGIAKEDLADPSKNIMFGAQYFAARAQSAGLDISTPDGLAKALRLYNGSETPMGDKAYDQNVMRFLPTGAQAVAVQGQLTAEQATQTADQRIAALEKETERLRAQASAQTKSGAVSAQKQAAIDDEVQKYDPARQAEVRAALMEKARAEEQAAIQDQLRSLDEQVDKEKRLAEIAKLPARERRIETQVLDEINRQKERGIELDQAGIDAIRERVTAAVDQDLAGQTKSGRQKFEQVWGETAQNIGSALENAIRSSVMSGKVDAESVLKGLVADIATSIMRAYITQPLVSGLGNMFGGGAPTIAAAHGMAVDGGNVIPFAAGGVVSRPTVFPMAHGAGLMGEAGPEAILPLKRGNDGRLGVAAGGGGGLSVVVNDMRTSAGAEPVETSETTGPDGQRMVQLTIRDAVRGSIKNGELDKSMRDAYGTSRAVTRR